MNSSRLQFQQLIEKKLGANTPDEWAQKARDIDKFSLDNDSLTEANTALDTDSSSLYMKSIISFTGGLKDITDGHTSWGIVKLYYALFYSTRACLCAKRQGLIRNKSWFHMTVKTNSEFKKLTSNKFRNDHDTALNLFAQLYEKTDPLQSNKIDNKHPFLWMMEIRNLVHYRLSKFPDPDFPEVVHISLPEPRNRSLLSCLENCLTDETYTYTFQPEYAWLAVPFKQILNTKKEMQNKSIKMVISDNERKNICSLLNQYAFLKDELIPTQL